MSDRKRRSRSLSAWYIVAPRKTEPVTPAQDALAVSSLSSRVILALVYVRACATRL